MDFEKTILEGGQTHVLQDSNTDIKHDYESEDVVKPSDYPEGGLQAWLVVSGAAAVMFCTFGYLTGFG